MCLALTARSVSVATCSGAWVLLVFIGAQVQGFCPHLTTPCYLVRTRAAARALQAAWPLPPAQASAWGQRRQKLGNNCLLTPSAKAGRLGPQRMRAISNSFRSLDTEPEAERTTGPASNGSGNGFERAQGDQAGFQPPWGNNPAGNDKSLFDNCRRRRKESLIESRMPGHRRSLRLLTSSPTMNRVFQTRS